MAVGEVIEKCVASAGFINVYFCATTLEGLIELNIKDRIKVLLFFKGI
jgi:hypothetical protein